MSLDPRYTTPNGPGGANPSTPANSLGGFAATTSWTGGVLYDLFGQASTLDAQGGRADYRCLFLYNSGPLLTAVRAHVAPATPGGALAVGADPRPVSGYLSAAPQAVETVSPYMAPPGVAFAAPADYATGVPLGDLPTGFGRALWVRRTPSVTPAAAAEACDLSVDSAAGPLWTRRVYWPVEAALAPTAPSPAVVPVPYVPRPRPFVRVAADFVGASGARVTWALDPALQDLGPYDFQLQVSYTGAADGSDDWIDAGPPARDAAYLVDPTARLWGASPTLAYRVVLTTAAATYVSPPAPVFGVLPQRAWLHVQDIVRKERLYQRALAGRAGFLLKARRYGPVCTCTDPTTREVGNSSCPTCYGTGIVGGYHPPVPSYYATVTPTQALEAVEYNENLGTTRKVTVAARMLADVPLVHRDAWISASGDDLRYYVWNVKEAAAWMDVPVVYEAELRLAPRSDVLYTVPVVRPAAPPAYWQAPVQVSV